MEWLIIGSHIALSSLPLIGMAAPSLPSPWLPGGKDFSVQAALADRSCPAGVVATALPTVKVLWFLPHVTLKCVPA